MPISFMESTFLFIISGVLSSLVITNAYYQKQQFYPSVVYITKSNASMGVSFSVRILKFDMFNKQKFNQTHTDNIFTRINIGHFDW